MSLVKFDRNVLALEKGVTEITHLFGKSKMTARDGLNVLALYNAIVEVVYDTERLIPSIDGVLTDSNWMNLAYRFAKLRGASAGPSLRGLVGETAVDAHCTDRMEARSFCYKCLSQVKENITTYQRYISVRLTPDELAEESVKVIEELSRG